jgi:Putative oxidoreductase C terminal domain
VPWILFPKQALDVSEICVLSARHWPTVLSKKDYQQITGDFQASEELSYDCNALVNYTLRGLHVKLNVVWDIEAEAGGGDTHLAVFRGSRARVEVRQGREEKYVPELFIIPNKMMEHPLVGRALERKIQELQVEFPGIGVRDLGTHFRVSIPAPYRVGHEAHFAEVTKQFLRHVRGQEPMPAWEKTNMMAKYFLTTRGVAMSRRS